MRRIVTTLLLLFLLSLASYAQQRDKPIKILDFDQKAENIDVFLERAKTFLERLSAEEKGSRGSINIYATDELGKEFVRLLTKYPDLKTRIDLLIPDALYQESWDKIEFWLVPEGADFPFNPGCVYCECPTLSVSGTESLFTSTGPKEDIYFTANVSGGSQDTLFYHWEVSGGEIFSGKGSQVIGVTPDPGWNKDVTATVELGGIKPECGCFTKASFTTKVSPK